MPSGTHRMLGGSPPQWTGDPLGGLEDEVVDHLFVLQPTYAVFLGLHQYDGLLPQYGRASTERWNAQSDRLLRTLRAIPEADLSPGRRIDRRLLELLLESPQFDLQEGRVFERNPMTYLGTLSLTAYMVRDYAPLPNRVDAIIRTLEGVPQVLNEGRGRLDRVLPRPFVQLAQSIGEGLPGHFREAETMAEATSPALAARIREARGPAEEAVHAFLAALRDEYLPQSTPDFALGAERYQRLLYVREALRTPFAEVLAEGWADLHRNQVRLHAIAQGDPDGLLESMLKDHVGADGLLPLAREYVEETKEFVRAHALATVPPQANCRVEETPSYGRELSTASMNPPGPYDTTGDEGIYYITPVSPDWSPAKQEEWLRSLNRPILRNVTAHEVYPGHYLQFLHMRAARNSTCRRVFLSNAFTEGWAHYTEQLMIEQGLGAGDPRSEAAQLHDALLRNCRLVSSIGLHTGGMTLAESEALFRKEAFMEELPARREAIRGAFDPEYFCYTLGKLAILKLRQANLATQFGGSLEQFHDRLLSFGAPPVGLLEEFFRAS
jgi:uncharacterized protein (DUF885 family)